MEQTTSQRPVYQVIYLWLTEIWDSGNVSFDTAQNSCMETETSTRLDVESDGLLHSALTFSKEMHLLSYF